MIDLNWPLDGVRASIRRRISLRAPGCNNVVFFMAATPVWR